MILKKVALETIHIATQTEDFQYLTIKPELGIENLPQYLNELENGFQENEDIDNLNQSCNGMKKLDVYFVVSETVRSDINTKGSFNSK